MSLVAWLTLLPFISSLAVNFTLEKCEICVEEACVTKKTVSCVNGGQCVDNKCVCTGCWAGETCSVYESRGEITFEKDTRYVEIGKPIVLQAAYIQSELCNECTCPTIKYEVVTPYSPFYVTYDTLKLRDGVPTEDTVKVQVKAFNDGPTEPIQMLYVSTNPLAQSRLRRSIGGVLDTNVKCAAVPYLKWSSYSFNKGDQIVFRVSVHNQDSNAYNKVIVYAESQWLTFISQLDHQFSSSGQNDTTAWFQADTLAATNSAFGNLTAKVKENVEPLGTLSLKLSLVYKDSGETTDYYGEAAESQPPVYAVYPAVNLTRTNIGEIATYQNIDFSMEMLLPLLNYSLYSELTTYIEDYVFMYIQGVSVAHVGTKVLFSQQVAIQNYSSQADGQIDRVTLDFGFVRVPMDSMESDRSIRVDFRVLVKDHARVENGSTHAMGVGVQAGNEVLWVEQHDIEIVKIEPALELNVTFNATSSTLMYFDDIVKIDVTVQHASTSEQNAKDVVLSIDIMDNLAIIDAGHFVLSSNTTYVVGPQELTKGANALVYTIFLKVETNVTPLSKIPFKVSLNYKNEGGISKEEIVKDILDQLTAGVPKVTFALDDATPSNSVTSGNWRTFIMDILLTKMQSLIEIEIIMPKDNDGLGILAVTNLRGEFVGNNIKGVTIGNSPEYYPSSPADNLYNRATLNLGNAVNEEGIYDDPMNKITVKFDVIVKEHANITDGAELWVGAGLLGKPSMAWVGQSKLVTFVKPASRPFMNINYTETVLPNEEYLLELKLSHDENSSQVAHKVAVEFYLPPYASVANHTCPNFNKLNIEGLKFQMVDSFLQFGELVACKVVYKMDLRKCATPGETTLEIPIKVTFENGESNGFHQWDKITKKLSVPDANIPKIPKDPKAVTEMFGRGAYFDKALNHIYVCFNQHVPTWKPACYYSADSILWAEMDPRVGCVVHKQGKDIFAVHRNQQTYLKYTKQYKRWLALTTNEWNEELSGVTKEHVNLETNDDHIFATNDGREWKGRYDGLYAKKADGNWIKRVDWKQKLK